MCGRVFLHGVLTWLPTSSSSPPHALPRPSQPPHLPPTSLPSWYTLLQGADIKFGIRPGQGAPLDPSSSEAKEGLTVFTTRPDTVFGVTHMVLAPEHPLAQSLATEGQAAAVRDYAAAAARKSDLERSELQKDKTGVFTGELFEI